MAKHSLISSYNWKPSLIQYRLCNLSILNFLIYVYVENLPIIYYWVQENFACTFTFSESSKNKKIKSPCKKLPSMTRTGPRLLWVFLYCRNGQTLSGTLDYVAQIQPGKEYTFAERSALCRCCMLMSLPLFTLGEVLFNSEDGKTLLPSPIIFFLFTNRLKKREMPIYFRRFSGRIGHNNRKFPSF